MGGDDPTGHVEWIRMCYLGDNAGWKEAVDGINHVKYWKGWDDNDVRRKTFKAKTFLSNFLSEEGKIENESKFYGIMEELKESSIAFGYLFSCASDEEDFSEVRSGLGRALILVKQYLTKQNKSALQEKFLELIVNYFGPIHTKTLEDWGVFEIRNEQEWGLLGWVFGVQTQPRDFDFCPDWLKGKGCREYLHWGMEMLLFKYTYPTGQTVHEDLTSSPNHHTLFSPLSKLSFLAIKGTPLSFDLAQFEGESNGDGVPDGEGVLRVGERVHKGVWDKGNMVEGNSG